MCLEARKVYRLLTSQEVELGIRMHQGSGRGRGVVAIQMYSFIFHMCRILVSCIALQVREFTKANPMIILEQLRESYQTFSHQLSTIGNTFGHQIFLSELQWERYERVSWIATNSVYIFSALTILLFVASRQSFGYSKKSLYYLKIFGHCFTLLYAFYLKAYYITVISPFHPFWSHGYDYKLLPQDPLIFRTTYSAALVFYVVRRCHHGDKLPTALLKAFSREPRPFVFGPFTIASTKQSVTLKSTHGDLLLRPLESDMYSTALLDSHLPEFQKIKVKHLLDQLFNCQEQGNAFMIALKTAQKTCTVVVFLWFFVDLMVAYYFFDLATM